MTNWLNARKVVARYEPDAEILKQFPHPKSGKKGKGGASGSKKA